MFRWSTYVWDERSGLSANGVLVVLALGTFMRNNGHEGYAANSTIAKRARLSLSSVKRELGKGIEKGLIKHVGYKKTSGGGKPVKKYSAIVPDWAKDANNNRKKAAKTSPEREQKTGKECEPIVIKSNEKATSKNDKTGKFNVNDFSTYTDNVLKSALKRKVESLRKFSKMLEEESQSTSEEQLEFYKSRIVLLGKRVEEIKQEMTERSWRQRSDDDEW